MGWPQSVSPPSVQATSGAKPEYQHAAFVPSLLSGSLGRRWAQLRSDLARAVWGAWLQRRPVPALAVLHPARSLGSRMLKRGCVF